MYNYIQYVQMPPEKRHKVAKSRSGSAGPPPQDQMIQLRVSPSHILQIELSEGVMRLPMAG